MNILLIDNYDSFTFNLYDYLLQTGARSTVLRNDAFQLEELELLDFQGIVLSPGPKRPSDAGLLMQVLERYHQHMPILGICLGHQAIGEFFGANLIKAAQPMHGKTSTIRHQGHWIFEGIPTAFKVMRYHSLILESLEGLPLEVIAATETGEIMALQHESLPLLGLQFHPESILTEHGLKIITNWVAPRLRSPVPPALMPGKP